MVELTVPINLTHTAVVLGQGFGLKIQNKEKFGFGGIRPAMVVGGRG